MSAVAVQSPPKPLSSGDFSALSDIVERVESLPVNACGAFVFTGAGCQKGTVCVEGSRVCWAAVSGMGRRLTDLVLGEAQTKMSLADIQALHRSCRVDGRPWAQTLVERGIVDPNGLRNALGQHTAEALAVISSFQRLQCQWIDRGGASYDAMFSFDPAEVAAWVGSLRHARFQEPAARLLRRLVPPGTFAGAYVWPGTLLDHLPIAVVASSERTLGTVVELGKWAHSQLELAHAVAQGSSPITGVSADGQAIVTWTAPHGFCVAVCESFSVLARVLSELARGQARTAA